IMLKNVSIRINYTAKNVNLSDQSSESYMKLKSQLEATIKRIMREKIKDLYSVEIFYM
ncbi:hypothetical protein Bpfe_010517, partial [Biomphalaria pfeifferi]